MGEVVGPRVTFEELLAGFRSLGVRSGDLVFIHASLRRFGYIEGGPEAVITSLQTAVGAEGTLAMPGFSFQLLDVPSPTFDVRHTPVWASKLYELFRTRDGVHRSHHVTHSVCAAGARANALAAEHSLTPCGAESPFRKFADWGAKLLLLGVSHNSSTTFHAVEEQEQLAYVGARELSGATLIDEAGAARSFLNYAHDMAKEYDFNRLNDALAGEGIQQQRVIGNAIVRALEVKAMYDFAVTAVRRDPEALLMQGAEKVKIPITAQGEMG